MNRDLIRKQLLSHDVRKCTFEHVRTAKIQISLHIRAIWSESSLGAFWIAKDAKLQADLSFCCALMFEGTISHSAPI